jgi:hypothetical protein
LLDSGSVGGLTSFEVFEVFSSFQIHILEGTGIKYISTSLQVHVVEFTCGEVGLDFTSLKVVINITGSKRGSKGGSDSGSEESELGSVLHDV